MTENATQEHVEKDNQRLRIEARTGVHQPNSLLCCPGLARRGVSDGRGKAWPNQQLSCDRYQKDPHTKTKGQVLEKDRT